MKRTIELRFPKEKSDEVFKWLDTHPDWLDIFIGRN